MLLISQRRHMASTAVNGLIKDKYNINKTCIPDIPPLAKVGNSLKFCRSALEMTYFLKDDLKFRRLKMIDNRKM